MREEFAGGNTVSRPRIEPPVLEGQANNWPILEQFPSPILMFRTALRVVNCSRATTELFATTRHLIIGLGIADIRDRCPAFGVSGYQEGHRVRALTSPRPIARKSLARNPVTIPGGFSL
jgi:hypothetical protein